MHLQVFWCYILLALLTNVIVEANSVDPDQQQSILSLHCLTQRLNFKTFQQLNRPDNIPVISILRIKIMKFCELGQANKSIYSICLQQIFADIIKMGRGKQCGSRSRTIWLGPHCLPLLKLYMQQRHKQMPFSGNYLTSALGEYFSRKYAEIDLSVF